MHKHMENEDLLLSKKWIIIQGQKDGQTESDAYKALCPSCTDGLKNETSSV